MGLPAGHRLDGEPALSLADVYQEHHDFVWRSVQRLGVPRESADDAVHDVFLVVAKRLSEFEGRSSIKTWLFAIALRVAQRTRRTLLRHRRRVDALAQEVEPAVFSGDVARREAADLLHTLLSELNEEKRTVFILSELEGMTAVEIASAFGLKVPTVYSRIRAAKKQLERAAARHIQGGRP